MEDIWIVLVNPVFGGKASGCSTLERPKEELHGVLQEVYIKKLLEWK